MTRQTGKNRIAKAFGVPRYLLWYPLTILICSYFLNRKCSSPDCEPKSVVKDGYNRRKTMPDIQMLECEECGRDFCVRIKTIFYWKHASIGELSINSWIFFGGGTREWTRKWICDVGKYCSWSRKLISEEKMVGKIKAAKEACSDPILL